MSKHTKTLEKLRTVPPSANIKWVEIKGLMKHLGYELLNGTGSRRKFYHRDKEALVICHQPHPSPDVDKGCIADIADHLRAYGFLEN